jgi:23S rRNA (guanosine2251-2'-O)-methyltransferase
VWITGRHPVEELLASSRQKIRRLLLSFDVPAQTHDAFAERAARLGIAFRDCPAGEWIRATGDKEGGGIAAEIEEFRYEDFGPWLASLPDRASVFLLDGITDPQNFGAVLRSVRAFGIDGTILPRDRSCPVTPSVFRASAGAAAHVPVLMVSNLVRTIGELQEAGFWVYAAEGTGETEIGDFAPGARTGIVLGGEDRGIRRLVRETCDGSVRIGMERGIDSLNVAVSAGIFAFRLRKTLTSSR